MLFRLFIILCLAATANAASLRVGQWMIVPGSDPLEATAAADLKAALAKERGIILADQADQKIVLGTPQTNPLIAAEHRERAFVVDPGEGYHLVLRGQTLWIVGGKPKGAMNGAFRLLDRPTFDLAGLDEAKTPAFRDRVGGHKMNQSPPAGWTDEDQARYYARHYINVVWGEKHGPPMSLESRQKYGLRLMVEMKFPPFLNGTREWMDDPKYASAVYYHKAGEKRRVADPFDPVGKQAYLEAFQGLLKENPDTRILYGLFGDYSVIPGPTSVRVSDGKPYGHTRIEGMKQIMSIMREAAGDRDINCVAWLWHGFFGEKPEAEQEFMAWLRDNGFGMLYNEAGNNDNWLIRRNNFNQTALKTGPDGKSLWGERYYPLVSVGGACESVNPVIGMPLPAVAAKKIKLLADAGVSNIVLWWGSAEGWIYNPNVEVLAEMTWDPGAFKDAADPLNPDQPDPLLATIAARGFGQENARAVLDYWRSFDQALVTEGKLYQPVDQQPPADQDGLHINDWYQRMGIFTETVFSQEFARPLTPESLADHKAAKKGTYWGTHDKTLENYRIVTQRLAAAQAKLKQLRAARLSPAAAERAKQMYDWAQLYVTLLTSQGNYLRALRAVHGRPDDPVEPSRIIERIQPVVQDELANIDAMIAALKELPPNANIRQPHLGVVKDQGSTEQEIASLKEKALAMKMVGQNLPNLALNKAATASSTKTENGQTFEPRFAVDGDPATRWASTFRDAEWIAVDLGEVTKVQTVRLAWRNAYPADFEIEVSPDGQTWTSVHRDKRAGGAVSTIVFDQPVAARHVRMKANKQATAWGYAIEEFEVFGVH